MSKVRTDPCDPIAVHPLDAWALAKLIRGLPDFPNSDRVVLYSCHAGEGKNSLARELAKLLGLPVWAPDTSFWVNPSGRNPIIGVFPVGPNGQPVYNRPGSFKISATFSMTSPVSLILVCLASLFTTGCGELKPHARSDAYSSASNAYLSQGELNRLTKAAMHGDGYAAERIAGYYFFFKNDPSEGLQWLDIAARNGNEHAREVAKFIRTSRQR